MKKWLATTACAALLLAGCSNDEQATAPEVAASTDDDHRIIAGTVVLAQILDGLDLNAVAVPDTVKELPARFEGLPNIGNAMDPDAETIKSLNPTEVLSVSTLEYDLKTKFEQLRIPVDFVDLTSVDSMLSEIEEIGARYDRDDEADALVASLEQQMDEVMNDVPEQQSPSVLILLGVPGSYLVATEHSYIGDLVKRAGGRNVMKGQEAEFLPSNTEYLYESNPNIILRLAHGMPDEVVEMFNEEFKTNDIWKHFDAVTNDRVYDLEEELFGTTAALNVPEALEELTRLFYEQ